MATGGSLKDGFAQFADKNDKKEITSKGCTKWFKDAGVLTTKQCSSINLDIAFSKCKTKGKTTMVAGEIPGLIKEVAKAYAKDKKMSEADAEADIEKKLCSSKKDLSGATKTSKTGGVAKMTDTSQYTGAHKERFDESGKGKGAAGREDKVDNTGYVGEYKGAGTHGKK